MSQPLSTPKGMKLYDIDRRIAEVANLQHALITERQSLDLGLNRDQRRYREGQGRLIECDHDVFRIGGAPVTWYQRVLASCLSSEGVASHRTAAILLRPRALAGRDRRADRCAEPPLPEHGGERAPQCGRSARRRPLRRRHPGHLSAPNTARPGFGRAPGASREGRGARAVSWPHQPWRTLGLLSTRWGGKAGAACSRFARCSSNAARSPQPRAISRRRCCS